MEVAVTGTGGARPRDGTWKQRLGNHGAVDRWDKEERVSAEYHAKDVPDFLERNERSRIEKIAAKRQEDAQRVREETQANYDDKKVFKFHQTKGGRLIEEMRQEIDERRAKELQQQAKDAAILRNYEEELCDPTELWQKDMRDRGEAEARGAATRSNEAECGGGEDGADLAARGQCDHGGKAM
eukprot:gene5037-3595_t